MIYSNGIAAILSFIACILSNEISLVFEYLNNNPNIIYYFCYDQLQFILVPFVIC